MPCLDGQISRMLRVLVTGASGFLGRAIVPALGLRHEVHAAARYPISVPAGVRWVESPDMGADANWSALLRDIDVVVHLAAIAHVPVGSGSKAAQRLDAVNVRGTECLASQAAEAGVRRFVFMSSIKAAGDYSTACALRPEMPPLPQDAYGRAKLMAERTLNGIASASKLEVVILRPPMVYGPNSKGNFALLVKWVRRGLPLPFGSISNQRSVVSVWNLAEVVDRCVDADVAGYTFHVADQHAVSTRDLVDYIARGLGVPTRLINISPSAIRLCLRAAGRTDLARRFLDSLEVDGRLTNSLLSWRPEYSTEESIARAVQQS